MATPENNAIKFADLGITETHATRNIVFFGKVRSLHSLKRKEIVFLVLSSIALTTLIVLTAYRLAYRVDDSQADFTFAVVLLLNTVFCLYYVVSGIFSERPYELGILVVATGILWLYLVLNYAISIKGVFKMVRLIIASLFSPFIMVLGVMIARNYLDSRNLIFRTVGAKDTVQEMCVTMFVFYSALKADLQVSVSMALLILKDGTALDTEDKILLPLFLCIAVFSCLVGYFSVRYENKSLLLIYVTTWVLVPAYAVYLIITSAKQLQDNSEDKRDIGLSSVTFIAAALSLVLRVCILFYGFKAYLNFYKGLRQKVYGVETDRTILQPTVDQALDHTQKDDGNIQEGQDGV